jgi:hypothetical protein
VQRDNCPNCEGTGYVIDFAAIRATRRSREELMSEQREYEFGFDEFGAEAMVLVPISRFCAENEFDADDVNKVIALKVGQEIVYGGGAAPVSRLRRVR